MKQLFLLLILTMSSISVTSLKNTNIESISYICDFYDNTEYMIYPLPEDDTETTKDIIETKSIHNNSSHFF